jgi:hypothetical protein
MNRIVIVLAMIAALAGCKKKSTSTAGEALAKMSEFADSMCLCKDKACAEAVQERMTKWSTDMAAKAGSARDEKPSDEMIKKMTTIGQQYAECMTSAYGSEPTPWATKPEVPATVAAPVTVEALLTSARTWASGEHKQLHVVQLDVSYVGADGIVDPAHGKVRIQLGRTTQGADDPKRRTGAPIVPVASQPTSCMELWWTAAGWTKQALASCLDAAAPFPRCPVTTLWKRAIEKGAPADALAVLTLRESAKRQWTFAISDELRKVAISETFDDDCEVVVEKP